MDIILVTAPIPAITESPYGLAFKLIRATERLVSSWKTSVGIPILAAFFYAEAEDTLFSEHIAEINCRGNDLGDGCGNCGASDSQV